LQRRNNGCGLGVDGQVDNLALFDQGRSQRQAAVNMAATQRRACIGAYYNAHPGVTPA